MAPKRSFPSTEMLRIPLRSETIPASAPIPTGTVYSNVLVKKTVRFAVVPSRRRAKRAKTKKGEMRPIARRHLNDAPRTNCSAAIAPKPAVTATQRSTTGTENETSVPPILSTQNANFPSTPAEPFVMARESRVKSAKRPARTREATSCCCASAPSPTEVVRFAGAVVMVFARAAATGFFFLVTLPPCVLTWPPNVGVGGTGSSRCQASAQELR